MVIRILLATNNRHKVTEIRDRLQGVDIEVLTPKDFPPCDPPVEDGDTFEENAKKKAGYYAEKFDLITLADDSGLVVEALGGRPGIYSSRYAKTNRQRIAKLLGELNDVAEENRRAKFVCVMVLAQPSEGFIARVGECHGVIVAQPRGEHGFGYDPVFRPDGEARTMAEMSLSEKNAISHRGRALEKMIEVLRKKRGKA